MQINGALVGRPIEDRGMENENLPTENTTEDPVEAENGSEPSREGAPAEANDAAGGANDNPLGGANDNPFGGAEDEIIIPLRLADRRAEAFLPEWLRRLNWA